MSPACDEPTGDLDHDLRHAIERDELRVHYQPIVDLRDGRVVALEALVRWQRPGRLLDTRQFLERAEASGEIVGIGRWVLGRACAEVAAWNEQHPGADLRLSVNMSAAELVAPDALGHVERVLAQTGYDATRLSFEVTETTFHDMDATARATIDGFKALGARLSIDDFGSAASRLESLQRHRVDEVKIDQALVARLDDDAQAEALVHGVILLAEGLGIATVAEGMERRTQEQRLRALACGAAQGWLYARPGPDIGPLIAAAERVVSTAPDAPNPATSPRGRVPFRRRRLVDHFADLFGASPLAAALVDGMGRQLAANTAFGDLMGAAVAVHPGDQPADRQGMDEVIAGDRMGYVVRQRLLSADGEPRPVEVMTSRVAGRPADRTSICLLRVIQPLEAAGAVEQDDAELRRAHAELSRQVADHAEANRRLQGFVSTLTHDLLQPVASLDGFLSLLAREAIELDEEHRSWLDAALRSKDRTRQAIEALHRHAVTDELTPVALDLGAFLEGVVPELAREIDASQVIIGDLPVVAADPDFVAQVMANLMQNAGRYRADDRPLEVEVRARREGSSWVVLVADTGRGIAPDDLERVFEPGVRGGSSGGTTGTGTGLATVRTLMRRMGGDAWAEPDPVAGVRICLRFAAVELDPA